MTVYQRIMRASRQVRGCRLSYDDCFDLAGDDAIATRAANDDLNDQGIPDAEIGAGTFRKICKTKRKAPPPATATKQ